MRVLVHSMATYYITPLESRTTRISDDNATAPENYVDGLDSDCFHWMLCMQSIYCEILTNTSIVNRKEGIETSCIFFLLNKGLGPRIVSFVTAEVNNLVSKLLFEKIM